MAHYNVNQQFMLNRQGKDMALYAGLLDAAHDELRSITVSMIQYPSEENKQTAIAQAVVVLRRQGEDVDRIFTEIGDASPISVGKMIIPHLIRMAATRAKARALRDAINVGTAAFEEFGGFDDDEDSAYTKPKKRSAPVVEEIPDAGPSDTDPATDEQLALIKRGMDMLTTHNHKIDFTVPGDLTFANAKKLYALLKERAKLVQKHKEAKTTPASHELDFTPEQLAFLNE